MDPLIIAAIISLIVLFILYKFARGVFKILGFILFISTIILAIITVFVFVDIRDFKNHASDNNTLVLLKSDVVVAAMTFSSSEPPHGFGREEINAMNTAYANLDFDAIKADSYKAYFIDYDSIAQDAKDTSLMGLIVSKEKMADLLTSNDTNQEIKNAIFTGLFLEQLSSDNLFLFTGYRNASIAIYPETALFLFIKYVPDMVVQRATMFAGGNEKIVPTQTDELKYDKVN